MSLCTNFVILTWNNVHYAINSAIQAMSIYVVKNTGKCKVKNSKLLGY